MEGKTERKFFSKKMFFMHLPDLETQVSVENPSQSEGSLRHSGLSDSCMEDEDLKIGTTDIQTPLLKYSALGEGLTDMQITSSLETCSSEHHEGQFEKIVKSKRRNKTSAILEDIRRNSSVYTQEESDEETGAEKSGELPRKKVKVLDLMEDLRKNGLYTQEEEEEGEVEFKKSEDGKKIKKLKLNLKLRVEKNRDLNVLEEIKEIEGNQEEQETSEEESNQESPSLPKKRKQSYKKVNAIRLKTFNKLVDIKEDSFIDGATVEIRSDEEIAITSKPKSLNISFLNKIKQTQGNKMSFLLARGILTDNSQHESLEISAPKNIEGFTTKRITLNPRELLRESLKSEINQRKTTHLNSDTIFSKTISDLPGRFAKKAEEDEESDYVPEDNEASEALEMEKIIKLEEGSESSSSDESSSNSDSLSDNKPAEEPQSPNSLDLKSVENDAKTAENTEKDTEMQPVDPTGPVDMDLDPSEHSSSDSADSNLSSSNEEEEEEELEISELPQKKTQNPGLSLQSTTENSPALQAVFNSKVKVSKFMENEAEVGSDHEEHDDLVRNCKDSEDEDREDDDKDLEELFDRNQVDDDEENRFDKHLKQTILEDELQISKVINAEFRRQRKDIDFVDGPSNILSKKQKLLEDKKSLLAMRENNAFSKDLAEQLDPEEMDDEEFDKFRVLRGSQELKFIRNQFVTKVVLDEQSLSYLSLITKPENTVSNKSLLSDSDKSNSVRVFKTTSNLSSNRSFVFSKDKDKAKSVEIDDHKAKKTKLYKLLSN